MISIVHWPWRVGLNPKAACLSSILSMSVLLPSLLSERPSVGRKCDPSTTQPYVHMVLYHPAASGPPKSPPTTSGFQFPVSYGPHAVSDRVWGTWHRAQHFQRGLIINMPIPTELSDIYSSFSGDLCEASSGFGSISGTACAPRVVNLQQESIPGCCRGFIWPICSGINNVNIFLTHQSDWQLKQKCIKVHIYNWEDACTEKSSPRPNANSSNRRVRAKLTVSIIVLVEHINLLLHSKNRWLIVFWLHVKFPSNCITYVQSKVLHLMQCFVESMWVHLFWWRPNPSAAYKICVTAMWFVPPRPILSISQVSWKSGQNYFKTKAFFVEQTRTICSQNTMLAIVEVM